MKKEMREDRLGKYQIICKTKKKLTTIRYVPKCKYCGLYASFTSGPTLRKFNLTHKGGLGLCPHCGHHMN